MEKVAGVTGLEPAASGVTGQRSNQLSYTPAIAKVRALFIWTDKQHQRRLAGVTGLEPAASGVTGQRSNQLSYTPAIASWPLK